LKNRAPLSFPNCSQEGLRHYILKSYFRAFELIPVTPFSLPVSLVRTGFGRLFHVPDSVHPQLDELFSFNAVYLPIMPRGVKFVVCSVYWLVLFFAPLIGLVVCGGFFGFSLVAFVVLPILPLLLSSPLLCTSECFEE